MPARQRQPLHRIVEAAHANRSGLAAAGAPAQEARALPAGAAGRSGSRHAPAIGAKRRPPIAQAVMPGPGQRTSVPGRTTGVAAAAAGGARRAARQRTNRPPATPGAASRSVALAQRGALSRRTSSSSATTTTRASTSGSPVPSADADERDAGASTGPAAPARDQDPPPARDVCRAGTGRARPPGHEQRPSAAAHAAAVPRAPRRPASTGSRPRAISDDRDAPERELARGTRGSPSRARRPGPARPRAPARIQLTVRSFDTGHLPFAAVQPDCGVLRS